MMSWTEAMFACGDRCVVRWLYRWVDGKGQPGHVRGVDVYKEGSGNPGAANVMRTMGRSAAALVLLGDATKGAIAAGLGLVVGGAPMAVAAGFFAVLGHCYPVFHRFRGGKGVATAAGAMLVAFPVPALLLLAVWVGVVAATRTASAGSLAVMVAVVPMLAILGFSGPVLMWVGAMALLVVFRHRGNIRRLISRTEATLSNEH